MENATVVTTEFTYHCPKCNKLWTEQPSGRWEHVNSLDLPYPRHKEKRILRGELPCPPCNKGEKGKVSLEERKKICEELKKKIVTVAKTIIDVEGIHVINERTTEKDVYFEIDGKNYYLYVNVNRARRHHEEFDYVGKSCGDGIDDSPYRSWDKDDEEE